MLFSWIIPLFLGAVILHVLGGLLRWLMNFEDTNDFSKFFFNCITSLLLFVFVYSAWTTRLATVNLGILTAVIFSLLNYKKQVPRPGLHSFIKISWPTVFVLAFVMLASLMWHYAVYTRGDFNPIIPHEDYVFYANLSEYLNALGKENNLLEYFYISNTSVSPYHYFELWMNSLFIKITGRLSLPSLLFFVYPLGIFLCGAGILSFFRPGQLKLWQQLVLTFLLLNLSGIFFTFYYESPFTHEAYLFAYNLTAYEKLFPIFLFMIAACRCLLSSNFNGFFFFTLCLPILNISNAPGTLSALFLFTWYLKREKNSMINRKAALGCLIGQIAFFIIFYFPHDTGNQGLSVPSVPGFLSSLTDLSMWNIRKNIFIKTILQCAILFAPYFLFFLLVFKFNWRSIKSWVMENKYVIVFFSLVFLTSLLSWAIFNTIFNSMQFFANPGVAGISVLLIALIALQVEKERRKKGRLILFYFISLFILLPNAYERYYAATGFNKPKVYGESFVAEVKNEIGGINPFGVFLYDTSEYKSIFEKTSIFHVPGLYLKYLVPGFFPVSLSVVNVPVSEDTNLKELDTQVIANSTFIRFIDEQKSRKDFYSHEQSMYDFILQHKIDYLLTGKNAPVPEKLQPLIKKSFHDEVSGESFILLNRFDAAENTKR